MQQFELILKNEKAETYNRLSWFVIALNFFGFIYIGFVLRNSNDAIWPLAGAGLMLLYVMIFFFFKRKKQVRFHFIIPLLIALVVWLLLKNYWLAAAALLLVFFQQTAAKKLVVKFFPDKILYPSFPQRTISWSQLNNIVLKDDLLTIDFKNNKIIQAIVNDEKVDEAAANLFFAGKLNPQ